MPYPYCCVSHDLSLATRFTDRGDINIDCQGLAVGNIQTRRGRRVTGTGCGQKTGWVPSSKSSSTAVIVKVAEADPAGMVTALGALASVVSTDEGHCDRCTSVCVATRNRTCCCTTFLADGGGAMLSVNVSLSVTSIDRVLD